MPFEPLDKETHPPHKRVGFLSKRNPKATRKTVIGSAIIFGLLGALLGLTVLLRHGFTFAGLLLLPACALIGAFVGAVYEWQVDKDQL